MKPAAFGGSGATGTIGGGSTLGGTGGALDGATVGTTNSGGCGSQPPGLGPSIGGNGHSRRLNWNVKRTMSKCPWARKSISEINKIKAERRPSSRIIFTKIIKGAKSITRPPEIFKDK